MNANPYSPFLGKMPKRLMSTPIDAENIIDNFIKGSAKTCMISGVLGMGKTTMLSSVAGRLINRDDWIVIDLKTHINMIQTFNITLAAKPQINDTVKIEKVRSHLNIIKIHINNEEPITNEAVIMCKLLEVAARCGKKVLVTIDDAICNDYVKSFLSLFNRMREKKLPIYLVLAAANDNMLMITKDKSLTFIRGAIIIELGNLNIAELSDDYESALNIDSGMAKEMAIITNGYPFAYQALGNLTYNAGGDYRFIKADFKKFLFKNIYDNIYDELSQKDRQFVYAIAIAEERKASKIKEVLSLRQNEFSPYRKRLIEKGIIESVSHGVVDFTLPYFDEYVARKYSGEDS